MNLLRILLWLTSLTVYPTALGFTGAALMSTKTIIHSEPVRLGNALSDLGDLTNGEDFSMPQTEKSTQLWLDLRGIAMHPKAALDYLLEELEDEGLLFTSNFQEALIDRVILSDSYFQKLLSVSDSFVEDSEILYLPDDGAADGLIALSRNGLSLPFGNVLEMPQDNTIAVPDPMEAMRILGTGKWIVLENHANGLDPDKESSRADAIGSFLDIASTASSGEWGSAPNEESGLMLHAISKKSELSETGGVAVLCNTKSFMVHLAATLQCFQAVSTTSMTESGIIIQGGSEVSTPSLSTAIILPFDIILWKTAMLIYGKEQFQGFD